MRRFEFRKSLSAKKLRPVRPATRVSYGFRIRRRIDFLKIRPSDFSPPRSAALEDMRVDHCRSHVFIVEKLLDRADIITVGQKMRGPV